MRRTAILATRAAIVLALAGAIVDLPLPSRSAARVRLHLIDRSDSVSRGPKDAPRPADADRVRAYDQDHRQDGDRVLWASFGKDLAFESTAVDSSVTNLDAALEGSLARNPSEVVLYTDGRADPGRALLLYRARGIPIHPFPLGAGKVRDVRIARVVAPPSATIDVTVVSTMDLRTTVALDRERRDVTLSAGVPTLVSFPARAPGPFTVSIDAEDDCPENNTAPGVVLEPPGQKKKVLILSERDLGLAGFDVERSARMVDPSGKDAVVLDNVALSADEQKRLARWVTDFRGGLVLLGGRKSFALGGWHGTPLDDVSPLRSRRDQKVAVIFVIDCSGSMNQPGKLDVIRSTVHALWGTFEPGDFVAAYPFPNEKGDLIIKRSDLNRLEASGGTNIADALANARKQLVQVPAPRRQIFLLTDGETSAKETPEMRKTEEEALQKSDIALSVITVGRKLDIGIPIPLADWQALERTLGTLLQGTRESEKDSPGVLELHEHPVTAGLSGGPLAWMNLTSARPDATVVGTVGKVPAIAFRAAGLGKVGAFAYERPAPALLARAVDEVSASSAGGLLLTIDPPVVRARGADPRPDRPLWAQGDRSGPLDFKQVLSDAWEAPLPPRGAGTLWVKCGRATAAVTMPSLPEYEALGVDLKALERIASETGGRLLRSPGHLAHLPRPSVPESRSARGLFLVAALVLVFLELAISTFLKA